MKDNFPLISVVIATKNEEINIENCLESISQQTYPSDKIEIIVVDNNSTDNTKEIARKYTDKVYDLSKERDLSGMKNYRGAQLNFGAKKSTGEIIFFPDADMTFDRDLLKEAVGLLNNSDALYVPEFICGKGLFGKIRNFERSFYNGTCIDGVRIVKKEVFNKIGGFDVENIMFGPDDWDFTKTLKKNGFKLGITEKSLFHHEEWMTLIRYLNKKKKYANTFKGYIEKWGKDDLDIKKQLGFKYRLFEVFLEKRKWRKAVSCFILIFGVLSLKVLVGFVYLISKNYERSK